MALFGLTRRRGVTDPVCGMKVDRDKAVPLAAPRPHLLLLLEHCRGRFETESEQFLGDRAGHATRGQPPRPITLIEEAGVAQRYIPRTLLSRA